MSAIEEVGGWAALLGKVSSGADLSLNEARAAMRTVLEGEATSAQIAALVMGLNQGRKRCRIRRNAGRSSQRIRAS